MKIIKIYQEYSDPLVLQDASDADKESYAQNLAELLSYHTITILETSHSIAILRPSKVTSIEVNEEQNTKDNADIPTVKERKKVEPQEDIITDA
jgi:hypothetical protein